MTVTVNTASAFTIRELSGENREFRMVGRGSPYRPFTLTTKQRIETTWLAGSPEATSTILGASEDPCTIHGFWKDKFIGQSITATEIGEGGVHENQTTPLSLNGEPVDNVRQASVIMSDFVRQGQLVEVTWDEQTRVGHVEEFEQTWHNTHDLEWQIRFIWISRGEPTGPSVFITETSVSETAGTMETQARQTGQAAQPSFQTSQDFQQTMDRLLGVMVVGVNGVRDAVANLAKGSITPTNAAQRTIAACNSVISDGEEMADYLQSSPAGTFDTSAPVGELSFGERLIASLYIQDVVQSVRTLRRTALARRSSLSANLETQLLGTYKLREGDDLRTVSRIFYGTPFEWQRLMVFNQIPSVCDLVPGQLVLVPKIGTGDLGGG